MEVLSLKRSVKNSEGVFYGEEDCNRKKWRKGRRLELVNKKS